MGVHEARGPSESPYEIASLESTIGFVYASPKITNSAEPHSIGILVYPKPPIWIMTANR